MLAQIRLLDTGNHPVALFSVYRILITRVEVLYL